MTAAFASCTALEKKKDRLISFGCCRCNFICFRFDSFHLDQSNFLEVENKTRRCFFRLELFWLLDQFTCWSLPLDFKSWFNLVKSCRVWSKDAESLQWMSGSKTRRRQKAKSSWVRIQALARIFFIAESLLNVFSILHVHQLMMVLLVPAPYFTSQIKFYHLKWDVFHPGQVLTLCFLRLMELRAFSLRQFEVTDEKSLEARIVTKLDFLTTCSGTLAL